MSTSIRKRVTTCFICCIMGMAVFAGMGELFQKEAYAALEDEDMTIPQTVYMGMQKAQRSAEGNDISASGLSVVYAGYTYSQEVSDSGHTNARMYAEVQGEPELNDQVTIWQESGTWYFKVGNIKIGRTLKFHYFAENNKGETIRGGTTVTVQPSENFIKTKYDDSQVQILPTPKDVGTLGLTDVISINRGDYSESVRFLPLDGYRVDDVIIDGVSQGPIESYNFTGTSVKDVNTVSYNVEIKSSRLLPGITFETASDAKGKITEYMLRGDADRDKDVDSADATLIRKYVMGGASITDPLALESADVNTDNNVFSGDATLIRRLVEGGYSLPYERYDFRVVDEPKKGYEVSKVVIKTNAGTVELTPEKKTSGDYSLVINSDGTATLTGLSLKHNEISFIHQAKGSNNDKDPKGKTTDPKGKTTGSNDTTQKNTSGGLGQSKTGDDSNMLWVILAFLTSVGVLITVRRLSRN